MPSLNQKGFAHILVLLILLLGLVVGLYLVTHPTVFKPKAGGGGTRIEFVNNQGEAISSTTSRDIKLKLTYAVSSPVPSLTANPTPTSNPSCQPRPDCLDNFGEAGPCKIPEPIEGWCPSPIPTPTPVICAQVVTPAKNQKTGECKDFPTPCDVPEGWNIVSSCPTVQGESTAAISSPIFDFPTSFRVANDSADKLAFAKEQEFSGNDTIIPWTLSPGDGQKTVYAQFKVDGIWQPPISASISLKSVTPIPVTAGVSFTLETDKNSYSVGDQVVVKVLVHSDIDAANLFAAKMTYDKNLLKLDQTRNNLVDTGASFIENWVEQYSNQDTGEISLVGGVPNPGFKTTVDTPGVMTYLYFTAIGAGATSIDFTDKSAIYRNSDNVNILALAEGVSFKIGNITYSPSPEPTESPIFTPKPTPTPTVCPLARIPILENLCPPLPTPEPTPKSSPSSGTAGSGDGNGDGKIDLTDLSMLLTNYNKTSGFPVALDVYPVSGGDSKINAFDFSQMLNILKANGTIH